MAPSAPTATRLTTADLRRSIARLPRASLAMLPTPLEELPCLSRLLGGPRILIKRDDCTGLAFGGNKTRHNEFLLGQALADRAEMLVWGAGVQSNNCRQTAAACAKLGLECRLVLSTDSHPPDPQGNLLLDYLLGASVKFTSTPLGPELFAEIQKEADRYRGMGRRVYSPPHNVVKPLAAIGYTLALAELVDQLADRDIEVDAVYVSSSGATGIGLALGKALLGESFLVRNIQPIRWPWSVPEDFAAGAKAAAKLLGVDVAIDPADIDATDAHVGPSYGRPTREALDAIELTARNEGILLDPSYTSKAFAGLIADIRAGRWSPDQTVVFIHTGGTPALFADWRELLEGIPPRSA